MRSNLSDTTHTHILVQTGGTDSITAALSFDEPSGKKTRWADSGGERERENSQTM